MGMKIQGNDRIWGLAIAGVFLGFIIWGFQGSRPLTMLAIIDFVLPILGLAFPSKYQPHLFTSTILLMAGVLVGVSLEKLFGNVPFMWWAVCTWLIIAVAVGVFRPFPLLKRTFPFLQMTAASDAGEKGGREKLKKYRPQIISILVLGMSSTIGIGIAYTFSLYGPDVYGSRQMFKSFGPIESALVFWIGSTLGVMRFGPFQAYVPKGREDEEA